MTNNTYNVIKEIADESLKVRYTKKDKRDSVNIKLSNEFNSDGVLQEYQM